MGKRAYTPVPVTGPLNTSDPSTNRPVGTLLKAVDTDTTQWSPRGGAKAQTWPGRLPTSLTIYVPGATPDFSFDGSSTYVKGILAREQADLGNQWVLDVHFHAYAARATANAVQIFQWKLDSSIVAIEVGIYGSSHATDPNKTYAIVKTTSGPGSVSGTYTLVGGTVNFGGAGSYVTGGNLPIRVGLRIIREPTILSLIDTNGNTAANTGLVATDGHAGNTSQEAAWYFGRDTSLGASTTFNGLIHRATLRDGVPYAVSTTVTYPPMIEHCFPRAPAVRFSAGTKLLTNVHVPDQSRFGAHGLLANGGSAPTINTERHYPLAKFTQGMGSFTDGDGNQQSMVLVGGLRCYARTR